MGSISRHIPVKLISGFIFREDALLIKAKQALEGKFGKIDFESQVLPFDTTSYYEDEFGRGLKRSFVSFKKLIPPENLPEIKLFTNKIEAKLSKLGKRLINIDPGYLELPKIVLATTKDYTHRIYLKHGICLEVTLYYENETFKPWPWTYPDYKTDTYISIFKQIRNIYSGQIKK